MTRDEYAILREVQVFFEGVRAVVRGEFIGWLGFLGTQPRKPAMADHERRVAVERGKSGGCRRGCRRAVVVVAVAGSECRERGKCDGGFGRDHRVFHWLVFSVADYGAPTMTAV